MMYCQSFVTGCSASSSQLDEVEQLMLWVPFLEGIGNACEREETLIGQESEVEQEAPVQVQLEILMVYFVVLPSVRNL